MEYISTPEPLVQLIMLSIFMFMSGYQFGKRARNRNPNRTQTQKTLKSTISPRKHLNSWLLPNIKLLRVEPNPEPLKLENIDQRRQRYIVEFHQIENERRRIAKELHDEILPQLSRLKRKLEKAEASETQQLSISSLHDCIDSFRDLLGELHPVDLEEFGLVPAISNICSRHARLTGLLVNCIERTEEFSMPVQQALYLYRAFQIMMQLFSSSANDMLLVTCEHTGSAPKQNQITLRCIDRRVESADWLGEGMPGFLEFEMLCEVAGAKVEFNQKRKDGFPIDVVLTVIADENCSGNKCVKAIRSAAFKPTDANHNAEEIAESPGVAGTLLLYGGTGTTAAGSTAAGSTAAGSPAAAGFAKAINEPLETRTTAKARSKPVGLTELTELALEEERNRITTLIKILILPHIERLSLCAKQTESVEDHSINDFVQSIHSRLGNIIANHHPTALFDRTISSAIKTLLDNFHQATSTSFIMISSPAFHNLQADVATTLAIYRITQEALNNVEKHSDANCVRVTAVEREEIIEFNIEDDGRGISLKPNQDHRGLRIMKERASDIGAEIKISTAYSFVQGTMISISLPKTKLQPKLRENPKAFL